MVVHQVEFLIEGYLLPPTMEKLQVSENLILEQAWGKHGEAAFNYETTFYAKAYVGVVTAEDTNPFLIARDYLDFFLLIYSLISGQSVTSRIGVGIQLDDLSALGARRISFPSFERIHVLGENKDDFLSKPILEAKKRFLLLVPDRQKIMGNHLGLALAYYYFAVRASKRRLEEAVINLVIAGEALLCTETTRIRMNLSNRLSTLIAKNENEKAEISKEMRRLYELRCGIIHGGGKKPSPNDVRTLFNYIKRAIESGLSLRHLSKKELVAKLDRRQLGLA